MICILIANWFLLLTRTKKRTRESLNEMILPKVKLVIYLIGDVSYVHHPKNCSNYVIV